jgi:hypothetical protein
MKVVIDSYSLLGAIGLHRDAFAGIDTLVQKQATALLTAQLKHKSLDLDAFRTIVAAIGSESFELYLDTADDKLLKGIAKKLDQHAPVSKCDEDDALRAHLIDLAGRRVEPTAKTLKSPKPAKKAAKARSIDAHDASQPHAIATKPPRRR